MIKARATGPDSTIWVFGLSRANIERLMEGHPILMKGQDLGLEKPVDLMLFFGETEASMEQMLRDNELIGPDTKTYHDPKLP